MPTWGEILREVQESANQRGGQPDWDGIRRKYLASLHALTGRDTIIYYTDWFAKGGPVSSITLEDMQALMEVCRGLNGPSLDLVLHSPGGSAEATASLVRYLRRKFTDIRVFVPLAAMSAATMWALSGNRIVMGKHSQLGPIDPQVITPQGQFPARAIIEQFERAKRECADPSVLGAWVPILQQYGAGLLELCEQAEELAKRLVREWLLEHMFAHHDEAAKLADRAAEFFADYKAHQSHSLGIDRDQARGEGLVIDDLEESQELQDAVLSVHHATMHTLAGPAVKIVENHLGRAFVKVQHQAVVQMPVLTPPQTTPQM